MIAVQMKGFPLAGMLSVVKVFDSMKLSHDFTKPDMRNLSKLDIVIGKITTNCDVENLSKPDIESAVMLTIVDIESAEIATNYDIFALSVDRKEPIRHEFSEKYRRAHEEGFSDTTTQVGEFLQSIKKGSTFGAALGVDLSVGQSSAASDFGARRCSSERATLTSCWISSPALAPISSMRVSASLAKRSADSAPPFNWRRVISPRIAVTMKLALLSPSFLTDAISSKTSCGTRAFICWDLLLVELVDIDSILPESVIQHTQKVNRIKELWCDSLSCIVNTTLSTGKAQVPHKKVKPGSASTLSGPLTTTVISSNEVAMSDHITPISGRDSLTPKKYQYRFLALSRADAAARPCRISIEATTEQEARRALAPLFILSLSARLPAQEAAQ